MKSLKEKIVGMAPERGLAIYRKIRRPMVRRSRKNHIGDMLAAVERTPFPQWDAAQRNALRETSVRFGGEIEINDVCNIDCVMCRTSLSRRKKGVMPVEVFETVLLKLKKQGVRSVLLHTIGEPLVNPHLADYLELLRKHGMEVGYLSSNCLLLHKHLDMVFEYSDVIKGLRPSVDAASKGVYEAVRKGGKWEKLHKGLMAFAERNAAQAKPMHVRVNSIISKDNYHEIGLIPSVFSYVAKPYNHVFSFINSLCPDDDYFTGSSYLEEFLLNVPCSYINSAQILKDGSVTMCCRDYHGDLQYGNLVNQDFDDFPASPVLRAVRKAHLERDRDALPSICKHCYVTDSRLSDLYTEIISYFYVFSKKHPMYLQRLLNEIGPLVNAGDYDGIQKILDREL